MVIETNEIRVLHLRGDDRRRVLDARDRLDCPLGGIASAMVRENHEAAACALPLLRRGRLLSIVDVPTIERLDIRVEASSADWYLGFFHLLAADESRNGINRKRDRTGRSTQWRNYAVYGTDSVHLFNG